MRGGAAVAERGDGWNSERGDVAEVAEVARQLEAVVKTGERWQLGSGGVAEM
jgi:hypothetical protein